MSALTDLRPLAGRLRHLPLPLAVSGGLLVALGAVGYGIDAAAGLVGAVLGVTIVAGGYALSSVTVAWADWISPRLVLSVGLASYLFKITLLGVALLGVLRTDWPGGRMMVVGMICAILGWVTAQTWWTARDQGRPAPDSSPS
jgi:hypothetical protein